MTGTAGTGAQQAPRRPRRRLPEPLCDRRFLVVWAGQSCSQFGSAVAPVALTLAVVHNGGSAADLGVVLAVTVLCEALACLPGGVWADRLPRNLLMVGAEAARTLAQLWLALELVRGSTDTVRLAVAGACTGAASGIFQPAAAGLVQSLVPSDQLQQANALMAVSQRVCAVTGPAVATTVALAVGPGWGVGIDALTFAVSGVSLLTLPHNAGVTRSRGRFTAELAEGFREVRRRRWYWTNLISHCLWNLGRCVFFTVGALVVLRSLGGELSWGVISQAGTAGALAGAVLALRWRPRRPLVTANVCMALGSVPLLLIGFHAPVAAIALAACAMNTALGLGGTLWDTAVQQRIPADRISRVEAFDWLTSTALTPAGMALAGPLAVAVGARTTLFAAAAVVALSSLGVLAVREVRTLGGWSAPRPDTEEDRTHGEEALGRPV